MTPREVVRCRHCKLTQFVRNGNCVRCKQALVRQAPIVALPVEVVQPKIPGTIAGIIRSRRRGLRMSQRQMAVALGSPRTWISKIERGRSAPTIASAKRIAKVLCCEVDDLMPEQIKRGEVPELDNPELAAFMVELHGYVWQLTEEQKRQLTKAARGMVDPVLLNRKRKNTQVVIAIDVRESAG